MVSIAAYSAPNTGTPQRVSATSLCAKNRYTLLSLASNEIHGAWRGTGIGKAVASAFVRGPDHPRLSVPLGDARPEMKPRSGLQDFGALPLRQPSTPISGREPLPPA